MDEGCEGGRAGEGREGREGREGGRVTGGGAGGDFNGNGRGL